jgi:prevent-host-death family protein
MPTVNMHEAKTGLSKLVAEIESGAEHEIIIARNGKPVARLVPVEQPVKKRKLLGIAEGMFGNLDEEWFKEWQALDQPIQDVMQARWDRFERFSQELDEKYGKKKRKKTA